MLGMRCWVPDFKYQGLDAAYDLRSRRQDSRYYKHKKNGPRVWGRFMKIIW